MTPHPRHAARPCEARHPPRGAEAAPFIDLLLELRAKLRVVKQYALADEVRNRLTDLGVVVEDTREGSTWRIER